jgi:transmembrane sensor
MAQSARSGLDPIPELTAVLHPPIPMRPPLRADVLQEAQEWDEALKSGDPSAPAKFAAWIRRSPEHLHAYIQHLSFETEMKGVDPQREVDLPALVAESSSNVVPLVAGRLSRRTALYRYDPIFKHRYGVAVLAFVAAITIWFSFWTFHSSQSKSDDYVTAVGEQRRMVLPDGSVVELNTQTHIRVAYSEKTRDVELVSGEALFTVQHNQMWPFRVRVRGSVIEDVGTQFSIYLQPDNSTMVSVLDGRVQLRAGQSGTQHSSGGDFRHSGGARPSTQLEVGQAVRLDPDGYVIARTAVNLAEAASWRQHRMWFDNATLQEIAREFNRYNTHHIYVINDPTVARKRYTATWDPYDPGSFISYLQSDPALAVRAAQNVTIIRGTGDPQK